MEIRHTGYWNPFVGLSILLKAGYPYAPVLKAPVMGTRPYAHRRAQPLPASVAIALPQEKGTADHRKELKTVSGFMARLANSLATLCPLDFPDSAATLTH